MAMTASNGDESDAIPPPQDSLDHQHPIENGVSTSDDPTLDIASFNRGQKRKFDETASPRTTSRAASPPWKKFAVEGPTSFTEGGRRKSARVNVLPLEEQPSGNKRHTRAAQHEAEETKARRGRPPSSGRSVGRPPGKLLVNSAGQTPTKTSSKPVGRPPGRPGRPPGRPSKSSVKSELASGRLANGNHGLAKKRESHGHPLNASPRKSMSSGPLFAASTPRPSRRNEEGSDDELQGSVNLTTPLSPNSARRSSRSNAGKPAKWRSDEGLVSPELIQSSPRQQFHYSEQAQPKRRGRPPGRPRKSEILESPSYNTSEPLVSTRLKLRVGPLPHLRVPTLHPGALPRPKAFASLADWLEERPIPDASRAAMLEDTKKVDYEEQARRDMDTIEELLEAAQPGGALSQEKCSAYAPDQQEEPEMHYGHSDFLAAHAVNFQRLLFKERDAHRAMARRLANACAAAVKARRPKTQEEWEEEQRNLCFIVYRQVVRDLNAKWDLVRAEVNRARVEQWERDRERQARANLDDILAHSSSLLEARRHSRIDDEEVDDELGSDSEDEDDAGSLNEESQLSLLGHTEPSESEQAEESENMSDSEEEDEEDGDLDQHADAELTIDQLRAKYADVPDLPTADVADDNGNEGNNEVEAVPDVGLSEAGPRRRVDPGISGATLTKTDGPMDETFEQPNLRTDTTINAGYDNANDAAADTDTAVAAGAITSFWTDDGQEHMPDLEHVDSALLDDEDESTDMDDDDDITDDDEAGFSGASEDEDEEDQSNALLGFLGKKERASLAQQSKKIEILDDEEPTSEMEQVATATEESQARPHSAHAMNGTSRVDELRVDNDEASADASTPRSGPPSTTKPSESESVTSAIPSTASKQHSVEPNADEQDAPSTPVPSLFRGTLRKYQHQGLDWLAKLYRAETNGILADEMGLGKTIQTIALLAHLVDVHDVWGPHLIVVPTSVLLNWEMEFKKFLPGFKILTYYGTQDERKEKRKGWSDANTWNVCITSYQLMIKDHTVFRNREWHYMVLDEAHNIKNFHSLRWQKMLGLRTKARLLLTGTPLQNNLTELWSLLWFMMPGGAGVSDLEEFTRNFKLPAEQIFDKNSASLDPQAREQVSKLHHTLRPYLLRRLKSEVEKQMPAKYEHVVYCRLSKRQRQLYDGFMSRADTKATLASGNYMSIIQCLMSLRKVCNHPDLFETRQIVTSFAMPKSVVADYEIKELLVRKRLLQEDPTERLDLSVLDIASRPKGATRRARALSATLQLGDLASRQSYRSPALPRFDGSSQDTIASYMSSKAQHDRFEQLQSFKHVNHRRMQEDPVLGNDLIKRFMFVEPEQIGQRPPLESEPSLLRLERRPPIHAVPLRDALSLRSMRPWVYRGVAPEPFVTATEKFFKESDLVSSIVTSVDTRSQIMRPLIERFTCATPNAVANDLSRLTLGPSIANTIIAQEQSSPLDPFHEARIRQSIAFPDKRLLQYDCGKLQQLDKLLRKLQSGGHRALIFTQMTKVLDILEQFLNIHGHRYLRLDGSTKIEQRQIMTDRFNNDDRILCFILSSRSGGLGINLTGADTVIFYDLDWNPAMDKQCQDRCHRIGQTRDVHIYRFVSESTIEANILRKSNQKRMLDNVVIQEGVFTTDYFNKPDYRDAFDDGGHEDDAEAGAAIDKVLNDTGNATLEGVLNSVEDQEDVVAARQARVEAAEVEAQDVADSYEEQSASSANATHALGTPKDASVAPPGLVSAATLNALQDRPHVDEYLLSFAGDYEVNVLKQPLILPPDKAKIKRNLAKKGKNSMRGVGIRR